MTCRPGGGAYLHTMLVRESGEPQQCTSAVAYALDERADLSQQNALVYLTGATEWTQREPSHRENHIAGPRDCLARLRQKPLTIVQRVLNGLL